MKLYTEDEVKKLLRIRGVESSYIANFNQFLIICKTASRERYEVPKDILNRLNKLSWEYKAILDDLDALMPYDELGFRKGD